MSKKYDVVAVPGKYTNQAGEEKNRYLTIGAIISTKNGHMLKLEAVPVGWAYLNEPQARDAKTTGKPAQRDDDWTNQ
jgi:hypothetical protein